MTEQQSEYIPAVGKRKTAIARVRLFRGEGPILVNGKPFEQVFPRLYHQHQILLPLKVTGTLGQYHATIKVEGGGITGWAEAIRHGLARALAQISEQYHRILRDHGLLTRDARVKERQKYGLKRARKAPQYTKR